MKSSQRTIGKVVEYSGRGLFLGEENSIRLWPQPPGTGINFLRSDLVGTSAIPAHVSSLRGHARRILIGKAEAEVEGIEHFMAALSGLGVCNLLVEITGREMPAGDGSATVFLKLLQEAGLVDQEIPRPTFTLKRPVLLEEGDARLVALPYSRGLELSYRLDFGDKSLLRQSHKLLVTEGTFLCELAPARTFCLASAVEEFLRQGWGKGVTEENCFLIKEDGTAITPIQQRPASLRFTNEGARHKLLDLLGDLYLLGMELRARVFGTRSGHSLNVLLAQRLFQSLEVCQPIPNKVDSEV